MTAKANGKPTIHELELVPLDTLTPHPENYRAHSDLQRSHLLASLQEHGFYRNVVIAQDGTVLAGHGVVETARQAGLEAIPVVRLPVAPDSPAAMKVLVGDNEIARLAAIDDRLLADLLKDIRDTDLAELLGTGFDEAMLANLIFVTRPESEVGSRDDANAWVGLPAYDEDVEKIELTIRFDTVEQRDELLELIGCTEHTYKAGGVEKRWSCWWPTRGRDDLASLRFAGSA